MSAFEDFFFAFQEIFLNEKNEAVKEELIQSILYSIYESDENPYDSMLQLHKICPDYTSIKPKSLAGGWYFSSVLSLLFFFSFFVLI